MIEELAQGVGAAGAARLLAVDGVQGLVDEEAHAHAEGHPPGNLDVEKIYIAGSSRVARIKA